MGGSMTDSELIAVVSMVISAVILYKILDGLK